MIVLALLAAPFLTGCDSSQEATTQNEQVSFQPFYDQMAPYGSWFEYRSYGYVWRPNLGHDFAPYATSGRWVFTDAGWTWDSDYPWGWAAFHYGRWDYDDVYGWFWVPDGEWGPAWVSWRRSPGYYGWTPLRPHTSYRDGADMDYRERDDRWIFVHERDLARPDIGNCYLDRSHNGEFIGGSRVIGNTRRDSRRNVTYIAGPELPEVQRVNPTRIDPVIIRDADRPGQRPGNGEYQVYRPRLERATVRAHPPVKPRDTIQPVPLPAGKRTDAEDRKPEPPLVKPVVPPPAPPPNVRLPRPVEKVRPVEKAKPAEKVKPAEKAKPADKPKPAGKAKPAPEKKEK
jgi:hypothetical protein